MNFIPLSITGVYIIEPDVYKDNRGYFQEIFNLNKYSHILGIEIDAVQDNLSYSRKNIIRGLHFQDSPYMQSKLVRCVHGVIQDVVVDLRPESPSFGKYISTLLSETNHHQLFIPKGCAHGFAVLSDEAIVEYKCDEYYHPESDSGIRFDDPSLKIDWSVDTDLAQLSDKDLALPYFGEVKRRLLYDPSK